MIALTGILLFVVLFYVYPLKFLWSVVFAQIGGGHVADETLTIHQVPVLFEIYGAGVVATFGILAAMYRHAYAHRVALGLGPLEILATRMHIYSNLGLAAVGLLSVAVAAITARIAPGMVGVAGFVYFLIGAVEWGLGEYHGRLRRRLVNTTDTSST